jgi:hypothetical protein
MNNVTIATAARLRERPGRLSHRRVEVPGGQRVPGPLTAAIQPPTHPLIGQGCVRNAGRTPISLVGTTEDRTSGREQAVVDGARIAPDVQLTLLARGHRTLLRETRAALRHMAAFKGSFVSAGLLWVLLVLVVLGIPALVVAAVAAATPASAGSRDRA